MGYLIVEQEKMMDTPFIWSFEADGEIVSLDMTHCIGLEKNDNSVILRFSGGYIFNFNSDSGKEKAIEAFEISKKTKV